jgi:hypothetical protein
LTGGSYVVEWNADEDVVDCEIFALVLATEVNGDAVENVDAPLLRTKGNIGNEIWTDVPGGTYLLYEDRTGTALCKGPWSATLVPGEVSTRTDQPDPTPTPVSYATLTSRNWALLVKAPDNYKGDNYKIWGCITQFDAATGDNSFRAQASYHVESYWYTNGANSVFSGDATALADYVQNDVVQMDVVVLGSITYDTSIGGKMTVPSFEVDDIKRVGAC